MQEQLPRMSGSGLPGAPTTTFGIVAAGRRFTMVGVAQLVELRIVIPAVVGSIPIVHPI